MKRIFCILMCMCMILMMNPIETEAKEMDSNFTKELVPLSKGGAVELEEIVKFVKGRITIPSEFTEFDQNYYRDEPYGIGYWYLNWRTKDANSYISVTVDNKKHITNYSAQGMWDYGIKAPKYLKDELKPNVDSFIKKLVPEVYEKIRFVDANANSIYGGEYTYHYERTESGIPMPDNTVYASVDYATKEVKSVAINWDYDVKIPSSSVKVSKSMAIQKLRESITMDLEYRDVLLEEDNDKTNMKAFLVYQPDKEYIAVDAHSKDVYTTKEQWINQEPSFTQDASAEGKEEDDLREVVLTEKERKSIQGIKDLISEKEAIETITKEPKLLFDTSMKVITANLSKRSDIVTNKEKYVWNIVFRNPAPVDYKTNDIYRPFANAVVDASTGKILNYYSSVYDYYNGCNQYSIEIKTKYNKEDCKEKFETFVKKQIPEYFKETVFDSSDDDYVIALDGEERIYGGYRYNYDRVNEKVPYESNGIYGAVDGVTGKIYSFTYNWYDKVQFESPKNAMDEKTAFDKYMQLEKVQLVYEVNETYVEDSTLFYGYRMEKKVRLVYLPDIHPNTISPFTGKQLNADGSEYNETGTKFVYSDLDQCENQRDILLLAELGIGFKGGEYKPNEMITRQELEGFLQCINAKNDKIKDYFGNGKYVTRLQVIKYVSSYLNLKKVAEIPNIYRNDFTDTNDITEGNLGYIALAKGLKLIEGNESRPNAFLKRQEAASLLMAFLRAQEIQN